MFDPLINWFLQFPDHGALLLVGLVLLICGLGLPLPEEIPIVAAAYVSARGAVPLWLAILVVVIAVLAGDSILFTFGRKFGNRIFEVSLFKNLMTPKRMKKTNEYFHKYGTRVVFIGRFIAGVRATVFLSAGILGMPFRRFFLLDGSAALLSIPLNMYLVFHLVRRFDAEIDEALFQMRQASHLVFIGIACLLVLISLVVYFRRRKPIPT